MRLTINFSLKKGRARVNGKAPIYVRLTMNGQRVELSSNIFVIPEKWDENGQQHKGQNDASMVINNTLDKIQLEFLDIYNQFKSFGDEFDVNAIKSKYLNEDDGKYVGILFVFDYYLNSMAEKLHRGYAMETYKHYKSSRKRICNFIKFKFKTKDYPLGKIDYKFLDEFDVYLKTKFEVHQNTAWNYHKHFRRVLNLAISLRHIDKNPYGNYKVPLVTTHREYLTSEELERIENKSIEMDRVRLVRDIFVFACYTGLSYSDIHKLNGTHLQKGNDDKDWIVIDRNKTNTRCRIPLLPKAKEILNAYENYPATVYSGKLLPVLTNQKLNSYLKEIGDMCNINKDISMHMARHTFATSITLSNGVPIETVSKMLGHTSLKTTQIYAKILDEKVAEDMEELKIKLELKEKKK
ncbi:site-specific integrase [Labilibaculum sp. DW002]|uniref:Site-specific integrase n=1 Tax=Paralabilibaculum antarcticum TaxID=2912572 RepID=A0ABT5VQE5_9BACT|nr:site-specific integrase [Labilibaculum sp. DW002]MDE5417648.1 site-specific integrase [Labilibaculum sp. DW002]